MRSPICHCVELAADQILRLLMRNLVNICVVIIPMLCGTTAKNVLLSATPSASVSDVKDSVYCAHYSTPGLILSPQGR